MHLSRPNLEDNAVCTCLGRNKVLLHSLAQNTYPKLLVAPLVQSLSLPVATLVSPPAR